VGGEKERDRRMGSEAFGIRAAIAACLILLPAFTSVMVHV